MKQKARKDLEKELESLTNSLENIDVASEKEDYNQTMKAIKDVKKLLSEDDAEKQNGKERVARLALEAKKIDLEQKKFEYQKIKDSNAEEVAKIEFKEAKKQRIWDNGIKIAGIVVPVFTCLAHLAMTLTVQYRDAERPSPELRDAIKYVKTGK